MQNSVGIDIGGSHITCGMYEHTNKVLIKDSLVNKKINTKGTKSEIIDSWVSAIEETISTCSLPFKGIGIAMPGPFDYYNGISLIKGFDKLESLYNHDIRNHLAERLHIKSSEIRFINDASAFSIAEALIGEASKSSKVVAITLGTGFGSSFVLNSQPIIDGDSVPEGGFLYNQYHKNQFADDIFSTRGIINEYERRSGKKVRNVKELCDLVDKDFRAQETFNWLGDELGDFIKPFLEKFDAEVLVIGGNISNAFTFFADNLLNKLPNLKIYVSSFGEQAAIIGSALLSDDQYYEKIKGTLKKM